MIARNYYPVDSFVQMDDTKSDKIVTVLNDRAQGGSADLSSKNTIELMQHRRIMWNDNLGLLESLNETDLYTDHGIRVNARYYLEIATQSTSNVRS